MGIGVLPVIAVSFTVSFKSGWFSFHQTSLVPVQRQSIEFLATTAGEWRRRRSLRRLFLTSLHHVLLQGGFYTVARTLWLDEGV